MNTIDKNSRILVTGASGFLGNQILLHLKSEGYSNLTGISRSKVQNPIVSVKYLQLDILDVLGLEDEFANQDVIVHTAGKVSYQPSEKAEIFKINVEGTANIVNCSLATGIKQLVHISSTSAFGVPTQVQVIDEKFLPEPSQFITDYALSKWYGELEVWRGVKEGLNAAILCPSIILGHTIEPKNTDIFIEKVKEGISSAPTGSSGFVHYKDICKAVELLIRESIYEQKFILSTGNLTWIHFFSQIASLLNISVKLNPISNTKVKLLSVTNSLKRIFGLKISIPTDMAHHMMQNLQYDGTLITKTLGLKYTDMTQTLNDYCKH